MTLKTIQLGGEAIAPITLFGRNRHAEVLEWHKTVLVGHYGISVNYLEAPFPSCSHGNVMNAVIAQTIDAPAAPDYYWWLDMDCLPLRMEAFYLAYQQVRDKATVWGHAWQSNHLLGPNGTIPHPYASQACLMYARELYNALGRPSMDHGQPHCDTAEALSYAAKRFGANVSLLYPSYSVLADTPLDNGMMYGMGNTYGLLRRPFWHHTSCAPHPHHVEVFTETCKLVLADAFEGEKPHLPYAYQSPI